tara:strand:+ start:973 stop:1197 length:225 start_codon:yes stop_codon:yes gene_type:complete
MTKGENMAKAKKKEATTKKYYVAVKQMQYFEIQVLEEDLPLTEDKFWDMYYDIGNCELDSTIEEMEEQKVVDVR